MTNSHILDEKEISFESKGIDLNIKFNRYKNIIYRNIKNIKIIKN